MLEIAEKFKSIGNVSRNANTSSSIFGSAGSLAASVDNQVTSRISVYPIIDPENPEWAMGIAACLCYLLEQYANIRVYRVFARVEPASSEEFDIKDSQFTSDDWVFDGLDDNIIVSGTISSENDTKVLQLNVDLSLLTDVDDITLEYRYTNLPNLINQLPTIAEDIIKGIKEDSQKSELIITYSELTEFTESIGVLLEEVFYWNLDVYFSLWNVEWDDEEINDQFDTLLELSKNLSHSFATWCVAMVAKHVMQIGLDSIGDVIVPRIDEIFALDTDGALAITSLGRGLLNLGYVDQAIDLVEHHRSKESTDASIWLTLVDIYAQSNRFRDAIDANQQAIENGIEDVRLYWRYTQLLLIAESNNWFIEELLLIDPDEYDEEEHILHELVVALEKIIDLNPNDIRAIHTLIPYLIEIEDVDAVWENFDQLVRLDETLRITQDTISHFYDLEQLDKGFEILSWSAEHNQDNPYAFLNLAQLAILDNNVELAEQQLTTAESFVSQYGDELELEIQNLRLTAKFPNFEQQFAEINTIVNAGRSVSDSDVTLLEEAIEVAPKIGNLYVTLANCYMSWNDTETAHDVLRDAVEVVGQHPLVLATLAGVLWKQGKREQAFSYLNEGILAYPNSVILLSRIANYLIENNQLEDAKPYIERADIIAPSHPAVWNLKKRVADKLSE